MNCDASVAAFSDVGRVELTLGHEPLLTVRPLGLVLKAGSWNLVHVTKDVVDVLCIDDLRATRLTNQFFTPPTDFDLTDYWTLHLQQSSGE